MRVSEQSTIYSAELLMILILIPNNSYAISFRQYFDVETFDMDLLQTLFAFHL